MRSRINAMTIRPNYRDQEEWTYAEAGDYAGWAKETVRSYSRKVSQGRYLWLESNAVGPFRVDRDSFIRFVSTGKAQGEMEEDGNGRQRVS
jgi:hypothetical protein